MAENHPDPHHESPPIVEPDVQSPVNQDDTHTKVDHPLTPPESQPAREPEQPLWAGRSSWRHYLGVVLLGFVVAIVLLIVAGSWGPERSVTFLLWIFGIAAIAYTIRIAYLILKTRYRLTTERLFIERGIISQTIDQTELVRVDDVRVHKTLVDRVFGLATIEIMSTDATHASVTIDGVPDGDQVAELIRARMRTARRSTLFMEQL